MKSRTLSEQPIKTKNSKSLEKTSDFLSSYTYRLTLFKIFTLIPDEGDFLETSNLIVSFR